MAGSSLLLCGAGKMGGALLNGWLSNGLELKQINVLEPNPSMWLVSLAKKGLKLNVEPSDTPEVCVMAVKPNMIEGLISQKSFENLSSTLFVSVVAGVKLKTLNKLLDSDAPVVRIMPNTPATIAKGVSCLIPNKHTSEQQLQLVETLFATVGQTIRLTDEKQMDAVTAISGSGPAYVFYLIEVLMKAGIELGLDNELASRLAVLTVSGSGMLAEDSTLVVSELRKNVTSPNGTTEAALKVLMDPKKGLLPLIQETVSAAYSRSRELGLQNK